MRKVIAMLLAVVLVCSMTACGTQPSGSDSSGSTESPGSQASQGGSSGTEAPQKVAIILQEGGLGDQGYNDGAKTGLDMMTEKYGVEGTLIEAAAQAEADTFVRQLAEDGYPLIICLDWTIIDYVKEASADYPDTIFVVLGKSLPGPGTQKNLIEPYTALHERGFMAAMASILFAMDGNEIIDSKNNNPGCTVAVMSPGESINHKRNVSAYQQAAAEFCPDANLVFDYSASKTDSALNQTIAEHLINNQGVEVIWPNIGTGSLSVYTACALNNAYAIGIDVNQDDVEPGSILSSALHDTTYMVVNMIEQFMAGTLDGTQEYYWGLESGVVGLTDMSVIEQYVTNKENFERVKGIIEEYTKKIESGEFVVYNFFVEDQVLFEDWQAAHPGVNYSEWVNAGRPE